MTVIGLGRFDFGRVRLRVGFRVYVNGVGVVDYREGNKFLGRV